MVGKRHEYQAMASTESKLWWYKALHHLTLKSIENTFGKKKYLKILDAGCGTGGLMEYLKRKGYSNISGVDISEDAISFCKEKSLDVFQTNLLELTTHFGDQTFDLVILNDILCYFSEKEQKEVVSQIHKILKMDGIWVCNVPALNAFKGEHDLAVGILQRFSYEDINRLTLGLFQIKYNRFWPFLLSPLIYAIRQSQRKKLDNPSIKKTETSDVKMPPLFLNQMFKFLTFAELLISNPVRFGSSYFFVARKNSVTL